MKNTHLEKVAYVMYYDYSKKHLIVGKILTLISILKIFQNSHLKQKKICLK
jgi:hypothetical protein